MEFLINVLKLIVVVIVQFCGHNKNHWIAFFKGMKWMVYELIPNKVDFF